MFAVGFGSIYLIFSMEQSRPKHELFLYVLTLLERIQYLMDETTYKTIGYQPTTLQRESDRHKHTWYALN